MKKFAKNPYVITALLSAFSTPAIAQSQPSPSNPQYAKIKGWTINTVWHDLYGFNGCMAFKSGKSGQLFIEFNEQENAWKMIVPTSQGGRFGGAILSVDKVDFDSQFGFEGGFASKELTPTELRHLKKGREVGVEIIGDSVQYWSLSGSTAAILKVEECYKNKGVIRKRVATKPNRQAQPRKPTPTRNQSLNPNQINANCSSPTSGEYSCLVTRMSPEPGYVEAYQVQSRSSGLAPSYFFKVTQRQDAEAWVSYDGGPWNYVGIWVTSGFDGKCSTPGPNLDATAQANLGQDAWELCVR